MDRCGRCDEIAAASRLVNLLLYCAASNARRHSRSPPFTPPSAARTFAAKPTLRPHTPAPARAVANRGRRAQGRGAHADCRCGERFAPVGRLRATPLKAELAATRRAPRRRARSPSSTRPASPPSACSSRRFAAARGDALAGGRRPLAADELGRLLAPFARASRRTALADQPSAGSRRAVGRVAGGSARVAARERLRDVRPRRRRPPPRRGSRPRRGAGASTGTGTGRGRRRRHLRPPPPPNETALAMAARSARGDHRRSILARPARALLPAARTRARRRRFRTVRRASACRHPAAGAAAARREGPRRNGGRRLRRDAFSARSVASARRGAARARVAQRLPASLGERSVAVRACTRFLRPRARFALTPAAARGVIDAGGARRAHAEAASSRRSRA